MVQTTEGMLSVLGARPAHPSNTERQFKAVLRAHEIATPYTRLGFAFESIVAYNLVLLKVKIHIKYPAARPIRSLAYFKALCGHKIALAHRL